MPLAGIASDFTVQSLTGISTEAPTEQPGGFGDADGASGSIRAGGVMGMMMVMGVMVVGFVFGL